MERVGLWNQYLEAGEAVSAVAVTAAAEALSRVEDPEVVAGEDNEAAVAAAAAVGVAVAVGESSRRS